MKRLTEVQKQLFEITKQLTKLNKPIRYDRLKRISYFKSFDASFNVLVTAGYFKRVITDDFSNMFIRVEDNL